MAGSRILVQRSIYDRVVTELVLERTDRIGVGDPQDPRSEMGTIASRAQYDKVLHYIEIAKSGAPVWLPAGLPAKVDGFEHGLFLRPTLFADVSNDMRIAREEVFGPIGAVIPF